MYHSGNVSEPTICYSPKWKLTRSPQVCSKWRMSVHLLWTAYLSFFKTNVDAKISHFSHQINSMPEKYATSILKNPRYFYKQTSILRSCYHFFYDFFCNILNCKSNITIFKSIATPYLLIKSMMLSYSIRGVIS